MTWMGIRLSSGSRRPQSPKGLPVKYRISIDFASPILQNVKARQRAKESLVSSMRRMKCFLRCLPLALFAWIALCPAFAGVVQIMPLGDSITAGGSDPSDVPGGYRNNLYADLTASGYAVHFVGSQTSNPSPLLTSTGNAAHEGHPGYDISYLTDNVDTWFASVLPIQPDLVVLMIGTNDINLDFLLSSAPERLGALLDRIKLLDPNGRILLSTIPWTLDANLNVAVAAYNSSMPAVAAARPGVWFFDNISVLDIATDFADKLHPNQQGYNKLGDAFAAEAEQILTPEPRSLPVMAVALLLAAVSLRVRSRRRC